MHHHFHKISILSFIKQHPKNQDIIILNSVETICNNISSIHQNPQFQFLSIQNSIKRQSSVPIFSTLILLYQHPYFKLNSIVKKITSACSEVLYRHPQNHLIGILSSTKSAFLVQLNKHPSFHQKSIFSSIFKSIKSKYSSLLYQHPQFLFFNNLNSFFQHPQFH